MQQATDRPWLNNDAEVRVSPYADREILKAKDDFARSVASGQFDEIQLEELRGKTDDYVNRLQQATAEDQPRHERDTLQQQFDERVMDYDGKLIQQDPETGRFDVLAEPVKDERQMDEMQFQQQLDTQKGRIDLMKQLSGLMKGTAEGGQSPMYSPEQIRQEVDRMLPEVQQGGGAAQQQFDQQWKQLPSGGTMVGPDGVTYRKK